MRSLFIYIRVTGQIQMISFDGLHGVDETSSSCFLNWTKDNWRVMKSKKKKKDSTATCIITQ